MPDHGGQPAQRDVGCFVDAHVVHDQIEQHVDACADLGDTLEVPGGEYCRGRSDGHDAARNLGVVALNCSPRRIVGRTSSSEVRRIPGKITAKQCQAAKRLPSCLR